MNHPIRPSRRADKTIVFVPQVRSEKEDSKHYKDFVRLLFTCLRAAPRVNQHRALHFAAPAADKSGHWLEVGGHKGHSHSLEFLADVKGARGLPCPRRFQVNATGGVRAPCPCAGCGQRPPLTGAGRSQGRAK